MAWLYYRKGQAMKCQSPILQNWVSKQLNSGQTVLDIGCGTKWYWPTLKGRKHVSILGIDAHPPFDPDIFLDLENESIPFKPDSFDVVLMLDFIEHLSRKAGERILEEAKEIVRDRIILLTPLFWDDNSEAVEKNTSAHFGNVFDYHKSLWTLKDFSDWERHSPWKGNKRFAGIWRKNGPGI